MEKVKSSASPHLHQYVSEFNDMFTSHGQVLFCQARRKSTVAQQHSQVEQRCSGIKHIAATVGLKDQSYRQFLISESSATSSSGPSKFSTSATDLCKDFVLRHAIF
jgi:AraC-like DNA-binding protein